MFKEYDHIALTASIAFEEAGHIPELSPLRKSGEGLLPGDVGTIVDIADIKGKGKFYTVEFVVPESYGYAVAITEVDPEKMRPATDSDFANNRFSKYADEIIEAIPMLRELRAEEEANSGLTGATHI